MKTRLSCVAAIALATLLASAASQAQPSSDEMYPLGIGPDGRQKKGATRYDQQTLQVITNRGSSTTNAINAGGFRSYTATGPFPNLRGTNANDLQLTRTASSQTATGTNSIVIGGRNNTASGTDSIAGGQGSTASGEQSIALGWSNTASSTGAWSVGGFSNSATSNHGFATGIGNTANNYAQAVFGRYANTSDLTSAPTSITTGSALFVVGDGTGPNARNNAFVVFGGDASTKASTLTRGAAFASQFCTPYTGITFPATVIDLQTGRVDATQYASGQYSGILSGRRSTNTGDTSVIAGGYENGITNEFSFIGGGYHNLASGASTVIAGGGENLASGNYSAISGGFDNRTTAQFSAGLGGQGNRVNASWAGAVAGYSNLISGQNAVAIGGQGLHANGKHMVVLGQYNTTATANASTYDATNYAFVVGNGTADNARSNAYEMTYAGNSRQSGYIDSQARYQSCVKDTTDTINVGDWIEICGYESEKVKVRRRSSASGNVAFVAVAVNGNDVTACVDGVCVAHVLRNGATAGSDLWANSSTPLYHSAEGLETPPPTNSLHYGILLQDVDDNGGLGYLAVKVYVTGRGYRN